MSAAQEREAARVREAVLATVPAAGGNRDRATTIAKAVGGQVYGKSVGRVRMIDFVLDGLEGDGLAENRAGWWRRTREGDQHLRNRG